MPQCRECRRFFARYTCGRHRGFNECDCPKCQGYCQCPDPDLALEDKIERERSPTGRWASSGPNIQSLPHNSPEMRQIRGAFTGRITSTTPNVEDVEKDKK